MVSLKSVESLSTLTTAERDALTSTQSGTIIFNSVTGRIESTVDVGSTWQTIANFDEITLQNAFDGGNEILQGANVLAITSDNTTAPGVDFKHDLTGVALQDTFKITTESKTDTNALKLSTALKYTTTNAADVTFSQDILAQAWSFNALTDVFHFVGLERILNTAPGLRVDGDGAVDPAFYFRNPNDAEDEEGLAIIWSECKSSTSTDKKHALLNHFVVDELDASFSTETRLNGWFGGLQQTWMEAKGDTSQVQMFVNFSNNQADPTYGTSIDIEDYTFADGAMIANPATSGLTGSCRIDTAIAQEAIPIAAVIQISDTQDFKVMKHDVSGDDSAMGVSTTATAADGESIKYCWSGDVFVQLEDGTGCSNRDLLVPSNSVAGRAVVDNSPGVRQSFATTWEAAIAATPGPIVKCRIGFSTTS